MKETYGHDFYKDRHQNTVYSAGIIISIVLDALPPVNSAVDFGCGVGTWLSVLKNKGVSKIKGFDGPWVERDLLEISEREFGSVNFEEDIICDKKYDLAMTLEVAEHISKANANRFVDSLVKSSDFILFSAAIPFQGGSGHVNEQWPEYWAEIFAGRGYVASDFLRIRIWNDKQIPAWYRQNILLFVKEEKMHAVKVPLIGGFDNKFPISLVHPDTYLSKVDKAPSVKGSWNLLLRALKNYAKKKLSGSTQ